MSSPITKAAPVFIKKLIGLLLPPFLAVATSIAQADWNIDLSRRQKTVRDADLNESAGREVTEPAPKKTGLLESVFEGGELTQEAVILSTERGFVPSSLRLRKGSRYLVHVVNVNEKDKNVSFVLDAFGEHHATYYGKIKSFRLEPKKEGVYSFQCPETAAEGRIVVYSPGGSGPPTPLRAPASYQSEDPVGEMRP